MRFSDLTREQKTEVKQRLLVEQYDKEGETPSYGELADADGLITDSECEEAFAGTDFVPDDFTSGFAADRNGVLGELEEWARDYLTTGNYCAERDRLVANHDIQLGIEWAKEALLSHMREVRE